MQKLQHLSDTRRLRIGTRGSPLALAQAHNVRAKLIEVHDDLSEEMIDICVIKTSGDRILDRHLMLAGGKGLFTKEIEEALLRGDIDCAVHSSKDMPTRLPSGLELAVFLPREDARDAFISASHEPFMQLPHGADLGTASLRRRAQALRLRPDLNVVTFRGNVQTRLKKLADGQAEGTFLALAGLNRMGMADAATEILNVDDFLPAPAQGAVTVEIREDDANIYARLKPLHCTKTAVCVKAERAFLASLDGSCRTPIAALATYHETNDKRQMITLTARLYSLGGTQLFEVIKSGNVKSAEALGRSAGQDIRRQAGQEFFENLAKTVEQSMGAT